MNIKEIIASIILVAILAGGAFYQNGINTQLESAVHSVFGGTANPGAPAVFETYLSNAQGTTDTTLSLASTALRDGNSLTGYVCGTIDSNTPTLEYECGNVSGTTMTITQRGLDALTGTTTIASLQYAHRRGADFKITDYPTLTINNNELNGIQNIPNLLTYANTVLMNSGSASTTLATKYYVDNTAVAGAPNATTLVKGIVQFATALQAASSTATGSTGALLALGNGIATDTPNTATRGSVVLMSQIGGFLNQAWLDLSAAWTWTGLGTFSGGLTSTATTTLSGSNYLSNALKINTVPYQFPSSGIASSTYWGFNANGVATYEPMQSMSSGGFSTTTASIGNIVVTHGLNGTPKLITIHAVCPNGTNTYFETSDGTWSGSNSDTYFVYPGSGSLVAGQSSSAIITLSSFVVGSITAVSPTTFTVNLSMNSGCGSNTSYYQWTASE